jgi:hypothetical protein
MVAMLLTASVAVGQPAWRKKRPRPYLVTISPPPAPARPCRNRWSRSTPTATGRFSSSKPRPTYRDADELISELTDQSLLGHVLADRYLSRAYKSSPKELSDWLKQYAGQPDAEQVYQLAIRKGAENPTKPKPRSPDRFPGRSLDGRQRYWQWGLENWRSKKFTDAAQNFSKAAGLKNTSSWDRAASAFWAARSFLRAQRPEQVSHWLKESEASIRAPSTANWRSALGIDPSYDWTVHDLSGNDAAKLMRSGAGKRALALIQVGEISAAEKELLILADTSTASSIRADGGLAGRWPAVAGAKDRRTPAAEGRQLRRCAMYPLPGWTPHADIRWIARWSSRSCARRSGFNRMRAARRAPSA